MQTKDALAKLEEGLAQLLSSTEWKTFLQAQRYFHRYSFQNTLLIWAECPHATRVAGFQAWKQLGRVVQKGEKGIAILAPLIKKRSSDEESALEDRDERERRILFGFRVVHVFDVSQTSGEQLPDVLVHRLTGEAESYAHLRAACPFPVTEVDAIDSAGGANGAFYRLEQRIEIRRDLCEAHKAKTLVHEWAHGLLHGHGQDGDRTLSPERRELEAESVAFVVCDALGLDTSGYSFGYLAHWNGEEAIERLRQSGPRIQQAAHRILDVLDGLRDAPAFPHDKSA